MRLWSEANPVEKVLILTMLAVFVVFGWLSIPNGKTIEKKEVVVEPPLMPSFPLQKDYLPPE